MSEPPEDMPLDPFRPGDINLPFLVNETPVEISAGQANLEDMIICGGVTLKSGTLDVPGLGWRPMLVFQFHKATGEFLQPIMFITEVDEPNFTGIKQLVYAAVNASVRASRERRNGA